MIDSSIIHVIYLIQFISPEGTPTRPTLTDINWRCSLLYQLLYLLFDCQLHLLIEICPFQLSFHPLQCLDRLLIDLLVILCCLSSMHALLRLLLFNQIILDLHLQTESLHNATYHLIIDIFIYFCLDRFLFLLLVGQSPTDNGVMCKCFQHTI